MPDLHLAARRAALKYGLDPDIFTRQIGAESNFNPNADSGQARGIAQFTPGTAAAYNVNLNDNLVTDDLEGAARYMKDNLKKYGTYARALSAYNSGKPDAYKDPNFAKGQTYNYVKKILNGQNPTAPTGGGSTGPTSHTISTTTPGVDNSKARASAFVGFLEQGGASNTSQGGILGLHANLKSLRDVAPKTTTTTVKGPGGIAPSGSLGHDLAAYVQRANTVDSHKLPYKWGGGHGGKTDPADAVPVDCSGAVSEVLGINPRVAAQFKTFGSPGDGGNRGITIYAKDSHVIMKINGHFFGTSGSNPGGGAGWIDASAISPQYLQGFTARHLASAA